MKVTLFVQCLVDLMRPDVAGSMVQIFDRLGIEVECPTEQTCCGQMAFNSGYWKESRGAAKHFISLFEEAEAVVAPSGSCVAMVRHQFPKLFSEDPAWKDRAGRISEKTFEFSQFLVDVLGVTDLNASYKGRVTYHDSCHLLRALRVRNQPRKLIRKVKGVDFIEMKDSDRCCGFGGAFSIKYSEISSAVAEEKVSHILESGADTVVGSDLGCLLNIEGMLRRKRAPVKVLHLAELLNSHA
ncbi:MAG: (Fe-S)-binding protein [Thermodesulfobacteriota bacterium]